MIISHKHRFIFLKTPKAAGTSVEIALSKFCGEEDILTFNDKEDRLIRKEKGCRQPQNYRAPLSEWRPRDLARLLIKGKAKRSYYNHMHARGVRRQVGEETWNHYYKFCVVRNPWDRMISKYYWTFRYQDPPPFSAWLETEDFSRYADSYIKIFTIDNEVVVDKCCRFEHLDADLEAVRRHLDLPEPLELPFAKSHYRKDKRPYREIFSEEDRGVFDQKLKAEIDLLDYTF